METYYTEVKVQADRSEVKCADVTIVVKNKEMTEEEFNKRREGMLDGDCSCRG